MAKQVPARNGGTLTRPDKGETMNPNGRPKGARSLSTVLREMLETEIVVNDNGIKTRKQLQEIIISKLIKHATDGNIRAITEIFDRIEGKAKQDINQDINGEIVITWKDPPLRS